jgi:hypothetical protein
MNMATKAKAKKDRQENRQKRLLPRKPTATARANK